MERATETCLQLFELECDVILEKLLGGLAHKTPKVVLACAGVQAEKVRVCRRRSSSSASMPRRLGKR